jgi:acetolactate synthase-1/2/3 large subunit
MTNKVTIGELAAAFLERCGVTVAFGVISIHNMPVLDAFHRRGRIRFVPARSEPGAVNMADAFARVSGGLGAAVTSTGTAAGNAAGAMIEALTAGTPLVHLTGQIESEYLDRNLGYIHEAPDQLAMLKAVSKAAYRIATPGEALGTLRAAVRTALTPPAGPVSVEIPIDVQQAEVPWPGDLAPLATVPPAPSPAALDALADRLSHVRRPLLWVGGGARHAGEAVRSLVELGFGVVTSVQGRGVLPEDHPMSLGAFNVYAPAEAFYRTCDALLVVGSRLRSNETLTYKLALPAPLYRIDADPRGNEHVYPVEMFVRGDSAAALAGLVERLAGRFAPDPALGRDLAAARAAAEALVRSGLGPYAGLVDAIQAAAGRDFVWVRDVTVSNSTWGNRLLPLFGARDGVHALGGGIGQGLQMGIGAALVAGGGRKTFVLAGDGGLQVNLGELATAVQERADLVLIVMNDRGYGVIRNIQDAQYGARRAYVDLHTPDLQALASAIGMPSRRVADPRDFGAALAAATAAHGPFLLEVDMRAIGPFATAFAGPPTKTAVEIAALTSK